MTLPSTIQAIRFEEIGGPEVLHKKTIPFPEVLPNHLVIKIEYLGINFIDTYHRAGLYPLKLPTTIGKEASGVIVKLPEDPDVLNNEAYKKRHYELGGKVVLDYYCAHAEYASTPWKTVYPVPQSVSLVNAAAVLTQGLTAITFATDGYNVQKGDIIFIHTVAGGLGLALTQYVKHRGASVIGTTSTKEKAEIAKAHGADHVILYREEDTVKRTLEITNGEGVHCVFDGLGKDTFEDDFKLIRRKGTIITLGNTTGVVPPMSPMKLKDKNVKLLRPTMDNYVYTPEEARRYGEELFRLVSDGTIKVNIFKEYPFTTEGIREAHRELVGGKTIGKVVVKVADQ